MAQKLRFSLRRDSIDSIRNSLSFVGQDSWYLFIGRPYPWSNDPNPDPVTGSYSADVEAWRDMLGLARIDNTNSCLVVRRINWTYNTEYTAYDHRTDYSGPSVPNYYVLVDDERVYKCIYAPVQVPSTVAPTGTSTEIELTSDGYKWKYLYSIDSTLVPFLDSNYLPVRTLDLTQSTINYNDPRSLQQAVQLAAAKGGIEQINIDTTNSTSQFVYVNTVPYSDSNLIVGSVPAGSTTVVISGTGISTVNDYYVGSIFGIVSGTQGEGQYRTIVAYDGVTKQITLDVALTVNLDPTTRYTILPSVNISGDGFGAKARIVVNNQQKASSIEVLSPGAGYNYATAIPNTTNSTVINNTPLVPIISPRSGHGGDPESELCATTLVILLNLDSSFTELPYNCTIRQYGLVKNPTLKTTDSNNGVIAGDQIEKMELLTVQTVANPYAVLTYTLTSNTPYVLGNNFEVGSTVHQYHSSSTSISTATVVSWTPSAVGSVGSVLVISGLTGSPIVSNDSSYSIGSSWSSTQYTISFVEQNSPDEVPQFSTNDYVEGDLIRGLNGTSTGRVFRWRVNNRDRTIGQLLVADAPTNWAKQKINGDYKLEFDAPQRITFKFNSHAIDNSVHNETSYFHVGDVITQTLSNVVSSSGVVSEWIPAPVGKTGSILKLDTLTGDPFIVGVPLRNNGDSLGIFTPAVGDLIKSINPGEVIKYVTETAKSTVTLTFSTTYTIGNDFTPGQYVYQGPSTTPIFGSPQSTRNDTAIGKVVYWNPATPGSYGSKLTLLPISGHDFVVDSSQIIAPAGGPPAYSYVVSSVQSNRSIALSLNTAYVSGVDFNFGDLVYQGPTSAGSFYYPTYAYAKAYVLDWIPAPVGSLYSVLVLTAMAGISGHSFVTDSTGTIWKPNSPATTPSTITYQVNGILLPEVNGTGTILSVDDFSGSTIRIKLGNALTTPLVAGSIVCQVPIDSSNESTGYAGFIGDSGSVSITTATVTAWEPATTGHSGSYVTLTGLQGQRIFDDGTYGLVPFGSATGTASNVPTLVPRNATITNYVGSQIISDQYDQYSFVSNADNTVYENVTKISYRPVKTGEIIYKKQRLVKLTLADTYAGYDFVPGQPIFQGIESGPHIVSELISGYRPYTPSNNVQGTVDIWNPIPASSGSVVYVTDIRNETTPFAVNPNFLVGPAWNSLPNGEQYPPTETPLYVLTISSNYSSGSDFVIGTAATQSGGTIVMNVVGWKPSAVGAPGSRLYVTNVTGGPPITGAFDGSGLPYSYVVSSVATIDNTPYFYTVSGVEEFDLNSLDPNKRVSEIVDIETVFVDSAAADNTSATLSDIQTGNYAPKTSYRTTHELVIESPSAIDSGTLNSMVSGKIIGSNSGVYGICGVLPKLTSTSGGVYQYTLNLVSLTLPGTGSTQFDTNREPISYIPVSVGSVWSGSPISLNSVAVSQTPSEITHGSGIIVYIENIYPIARKTTLSSGTPVQSETIRIAIGL